MFKLETCMHDLEFHHYAKTLMFLWFVILDKMNKIYAHFHISLHLFQVTLKLGYHSMKSIGMTKGISCSIENEL